MNTYIFNHNQNKIYEKIQMIFVGEDTIYNEEIGNMYNLYDFIRSTDFNGDRVIFNNFTYNKIEKIAFYISKYKNIDSISGYNGMIISNKKKNRGLNYAKMDRWTKRSNI